MSLTNTLPSLSGTRGSKEEAQFDLVHAVALREQRGRAHVAVVGTVAMAWRRRDAPHRAPHLSLTSLPPLTPAPQPAGHRSRRPRTMSVHAPRRPGPECVEAAKELHRGTNANVGLAEVGEDGKDEYGVGMKVEKMDLVCLQDRLEEVGEGRNETGEEAVEEDRDRKSVV